MKRYRPILFLLAMCAGSIVPAADSQLTSVTSIVGELRVGIIDGAIPFSYTTEESTAAVGHQVDLATQFARDMDVKLSLRPSDLDTLVKQLAAGSIDIIMAGTPMNAALAKRAAFTQPWGSTGFTPVTLRASVGRYRDWPDLGAAQTRISVSSDGQIAAFLASMAPGKEYEIVDSTPAAIDALVTGKTDVYLTNTIEASVLARIDNRLAVLFPNRAANRRPLACLVRIDDPIWLHYVNTWLTIKRETGYLATLARKWGLVGQ